MDPEFVLDAVNSQVMSSGSLTNFSARIEIVLEEVMQLGFALRYADESLRMVRELVLDAVIQPGLIIFSRRVSQHGPRVCTRRFKIVRSCPQGTPTSLISTRGDVIARISPTLSRRVSLHIFRDCTRRGVTVWSCATVPRTIRFA